MSNRSSRLHLFILLVVRSPSSGANNHESPLCSSGLNIFNIHIIIIIETAPGYIYRLFSVLWFPIEWFRVGFYVFSQNGSMRQKLISWTTFSSCQRACSLYWFIFFT